MGKSESITATEYSDYEDECFTPSTSASNERTVNLNRDANTSDEQPDWHSYLKTGAWFATRTFPSAQFMIHGVVPEGLGVLVAPPKSGKSWMSLGFCLAVCSGGTALGCLQVKKRPAVFYGLEDGSRRMKNRLEELLQGESIPEEFQCFTGDLPRAHVLDSVGEWLEENGSGLVILDTLGTVRPPAYKNESEYDRDYRFGSKLKALCDKHPGSGILVVHHTRKTNGDEDWMNSVLGSQGINGSADYTIGLFRQRGHDDATLKVTGRDIEDSEYALNFDSGTWILDGGGLEASARAVGIKRKTDDLGDVSSQIVRYVNAHYEGVTPAEVAEALNLDRDITQRYLSRCVKAEKILRPGRGVYAPVCNH